MERTYNNDYQMLYQTEPKHIDKNLERFIRKKEEALERKLTETKNRE